MTRVMTRAYNCTHAMVDYDRNRPRVSLTVDPVTAAYLTHNEVTGGRAVDAAIKKHISNDRLAQIASNAGVTADETDFYDLDLPAGETDD